MGRRETGIYFRPVDLFVDGEIPASDDGDGRRFSCLVGVQLDISPPPSEPEGHPELRQPVVGSKDVAAIFTSYFEKRL